LRPDSVAPAIRSLTATGAVSGITLDWPTTAKSICRYNVYRSSAIDGIFTS